VPDCALVAFCFSTAHALMQLDRVAAWEPCSADLPLASGLERRSAGAGRTGSMVSMYCKACGS
jgi:hypothetical protein